MRNACILLMAVGAVLGAWPNAALAEPECTTTFNVSDGAWDNDENWTHDAPDSDDVACILDDQIARITDYEAQAKAIVVDPAESGLHVWGKIVISGDDGVLKIWEDSWVHGLITIDRDAELTIMDPLTITGEGGKIQGVKVSAGSVKAFITNDAVNDTLTIEGVGHEGTHDSLMIHGHIGISAKLVNNAYVIADDEDLDLEDPSNAGRDKSGNSEGHWIAKGDGRLHVKDGCTVSGSGSWTLDDDADAEIQIDEECTNLGGPVTIKHGTLDLNENFTTTGQLTFQSVDSSHPKIELAEGKGATFDN